MAKFAVVLFTCSLLLGNCGHHADIFITNSCFYLAKKNMHSMLIIILTKIFIINLSICFGPNAFQGINTKLLPCKSTCNM